MDVFQKGPVSVPQGSVHPCVEDDCPRLKADAEIPTRGLSRPQQSTDDRQAWPFRGSWEGAAKAVGLRPPLNVTAWHSFSLLSRRFLWGVGLAVEPGDWLQSRLLLSFQPFYQAAGGGQRPQAEVQSTALAPRGDLVDLGPNRTGMCPIDISEARVTAEASLPFALLPSVSSLCQENSCSVQLFVGSSRFSPLRAVGQGCSSLPVQDTLVQAALGPAGSGFC